MTPERIAEACSAYSRARYLDRKEGNGCRTHQDALPDWVLEGRRDYFRAKMRERRQSQSNPRIEDIRLVRHGVPAQDWNRVLQWAHDERKAHGTAKFGTSMLLHDDGFIDPVAVELAVTGKRQVRMTRSERLEALRRLRGSLSHAEIGERLGISESNAKRLSVEVRLDGATGCL